MRSGRLARLVKLLDGTWPASPPHRVAQWNLFGLDGMQLLLAYFGYLVLEYRQYVSLVWLLYSMTCGCNIFIRQLKSLTHI